MRYFIFLFFPALLLAGGKHKRDGANLPENEKKFAQLLGVHYRRVYCGNFSQSQRLSAIKYSSSRSHDTMLSPNEAVVKVMEESGLPLTSLGKVK